MNNQDNSTNLAKAIKDFEDSFYREKEGKLYKFLLDLIERPVIENVLHKTGGNQLKAAKILGINRNTLHAKIKKLNIYIDNFKCSKRLKTEKEV